MDISTDQNRLDITWAARRRIWKNDEHFTLHINSLKKTVLDIHNALLSHDSYYYIYAKKADNHDYWGVTRMKLRVHGKIILTE